MIGCIIYSRIETLFLKFSIFLAIFGSFWSLTLQLLSRRKFEICKMRKFKMPSRVSLWNFYFGFVGYINVCFNYKTLHNKFNLLDISVGEVFTGQKRQKGRFLPKNTKICPFWRFCPPKTSSTEISKRLNLICSVL